MDLNISFNHKPIEAKFEYAIISKTIIIHDLWHENINCKTVTNDVENVINIINRRIEGFKNRKVIYQDTSGYWDEIVIRDDQFYEFNLLNKKNIYDALNELYKKRGKNEIKNNNDGH